MKILIFTEGTILMHKSAKGVSREERVKQSQEAGIQGEEKDIVYEDEGSISSAQPGSVYDLSSYLPNGNAVKKLIDGKNKELKFII